MKDLNNIAQAINASILEKLEKISEPRREEAIDKAKFRNDYRNFRHLVMENILEVSKKIQEGQEKVSKASKYIIDQFSYIESLLPDEPTEAYKMLKNYIMSGVYVDDNTLKDLVEKLSNIEQYIIKNLIKNNNNENI